MANFNTHLTVAAVGSGCATLASLITYQLTVLEVTILFMLGTVSGLLPDIDSDHSIPARWLFRILMGTAIMFTVVLTYQTFVFWKVGLFVCIVALSMHFILFKLFKKITSHRGVFHSVPAAILFTLAIHSVGVYFMAWPLSFSWLAAAFVGGGYLLHLSLDELFSVDLTGRTLKKSFGSALTIFKFKSWWHYTILYILIFIGMIYLPMPEPLATLTHLFAPYI